MIIIFICLYWTQPGPGNECATLHICDDRPAPVDLGAPREWRPAVQPPNRRSGTVRPEYRSQPRQAASGKRQRNRAKQADRPKVKTGLSPALVPSRLALVPPAPPLPLPFPFPFPLPVPLPAPLPPSLILPHASDHAAQHVARVDAEWPLQARARGPPPDHRACRWRRKRSGRSGRTENAGERSPVSPPTGMGRGTVLVELTFRYRSSLPCSSHISVPSISGSTNTSATSPPTLYFALSTLPTSA